MAQAHKFTREGKKKQVVPHPPCILCGEPTTLVYLVPPPGMKKPKIHFWCRDCQTWFRSPAR